MDAEELSISHDHLQAAQSWMNSVCGPHQLAQRSRAPVEFRHQAVRLPGLGTVIGHIGYGTEVAISVQAAGFEVFSLSLPCEGEQILHRQGASYVSTKERGIIIAPAAEQLLEMSAHCRKLQVVIPQAAMRQIAAELAGPSGPAALTLAPEMDLRDPGISAWWRMIGQTLSGWAHIGALWHLPGLVTDLERLLIKSLLLAQPGSFTSSQGGRLPGFMQRIEQFLALHLGEKIDLAQLESVAGVSRQKLYNAFHTLYGCAPLAYVKRRRLEAVRRALAEGLRPGETISALAWQWGFEHLSRFSHDYAEAFGELPSATAARAGKRQR